mgnify:CR=1 FL=1
MSVSFLSAQILIDNTPPYNNPNWLVDNILLGGGIVASNHAFQGDPVQIGWFNALNTTLGIDSGIGGAVASSVGERLRRLGKNRQVIVITHSPQEAAQAHRILILNKGEIVGNASPRKIYYDLKGVQKFQLETPFSTKLGIAINESKNALSIDEFVENWNKPILSNTRLIKPSAENTSGVISIELKNIQHNSFLLH